MSSIEDAAKPRSCRNMLRMRCLQCLFVDCGSWRAPPFGLATVYRTQLPREIRLRYLDPCRRVSACMEPVLALLSVERCADLSSMRVTTSEAEA